MSFLDKYWNSIQPRSTEGVNPECEATGYIMPWNHDRANMEMICNALTLMKPRKVVETGTFEALGTMYIARVMSRYSQIRLSELWTFDAGLPYFSVDGSPNFLIDPDSDEKFESWDKVVKAREKRVNDHYPGVTVKYVEGLTRDTLPESLKEIGFWDFWYQDSIHDLNGILEEFVLMEPYAQRGAIIVFDDVLEGSPWMQWFLENSKGWIWRHSTISRQQLWAERIR